MDWFLYLIVCIVVGLICGLIGDAISKNRNMDGGFLWGFFLGVIGIIVVAVRPNDNQKVKASSFNSLEKSQREREQEMLDEGGWKCVCGRVNYHYVSSCPVCRKSRREGDINNILREQANAEKKDDAEKIKEKITEFKKLLDEGIITQEEYEAKRKQILGL